MSLAINNRTVGELIADPTTPRHVRRLMHEAVESWRAAEVLKLREWAGVKAPEDVTK